MIMTVFYVDEVGPIPLDANNMSGETIRGYKNGGTYNFASVIKNIWNEITKFKFIWPKRSI